MQARASVRYQPLLGDIVLANQPAPLGVIAFEQFGEFSRSRRHRVRSRADEALAHIGHGDRLAHGVIQTVDDLARRFRRREDCIPVRCFDVFETLLDRKSVV